MLLWSKGFVLFCFVLLCSLKLQIIYLENCFCEWYQKYFEKCLKLQTEFGAKAQVYNCIFVASLRVTVFSVPFLTLDISYMTSVSS